MAQVQTDWAEFERMVAPLSDVRRPLPLSAAAANIANNPSKARIRRVRGAAGCGKSLGLAARAARLAHEGKEVLVVTFNSTLTHYLRDLAADHCHDLGAPLNRITFAHLLALCERAIDDSRIAGADVSAAVLPGMLSAYEELIDRGIEAYRLGYGRRFDAGAGRRGAGLQPEVVELPAPPGVPPRW